MGAPGVSDGAEVVARTALVLVVALLLQVGLFDELRVFSVHAELLLAVGLGTAVAWGPERGAVVCFVAGCLADLILHTRFGLSALAYGVAGYGVGFLADGVARRSRLIDAGLMALGGLAGMLLYAVVGALFGESTLGDDHLWRIVGMVTMWTALLSPVVVPACRWAGPRANVRTIR